MRQWIEIWHILKRTKKDNYKKMVLEKNIVSPFKTKVMNIFQRSW